ncbi:MAG: branched-chain amino acid ABC transporter permease [Anaerovorax sp.]|nr:branched-chain amino acid ABC transporter permease [Anaerovorax sp.]
MFSWYYISGILILTGINLLTVLGLSLLTGFTGLFSFGHAGFMAIGAYTAATMTMRFHMPLLLALLVGGVVSMLVSFIIGRLTLNLKGDYFCIATLGFGEATRLILDNVQYFGGSRGLPGIPTYENNQYLAIVVFINVLAIVAMVFLIRSRHGRNMVAIREEELASQAIGINVFRYKMTSLAVSALYAGVAGGLMAHYLGYIQPIMFQLIKSTELTIIVIFGGLGSITGSVVGAIILTFLPEMLRSFSQWRLVVYGAAVILIMITRPQGLMGGKELNLKAIYRWFVNRRGGAENDSSSIS